MQKIISFSLVFIIFTSICFTSCSSNNKVSNDGEKQEDTVIATTEEEITAQSVLAKFPDKDLEGRTFTIWTSNYINSDLFKRVAPEEQMNSEPVNDKLIERDIMVEDKFNITINYKHSDFNGPTLYNEVKKAILAQDGSFDIIIGDIANTCISSLQEGFAMDLCQYPYIDFENKWWNQNATNSFVINDKVFFGVGDISPTNMYAPFMTMFNKQEFINRGIDFPYQLVRDGKWTLEAMEKIVKDTTTDLNGDGVIDKEDFHGYLTEISTAYVSFVGGGGKIIDIQNNVPVVTCNTPKGIDIIQKFSEFFKSDSVYKGYNDSLYNPLYSFMEGHGMMVGSTAINFSMVSEYELDYGLVPPPKLDENQDKYYTMGNPWCLMGTIIPITNTDPENTALIVEALTAVSKYTSSPAAYEITLLTKQTRDEESIEMLELATNSMVIDIGMIFNWGNIYPALQNSILNNKNFISSYEKIAGVVEKKIEEFIETTMD